MSMLNIGTHSIAQQTTYFMTVTNGL